MKQQRGNILFLILLAVVLFAALSYAVTSSTRGGGKDISDEDAKMAAANILQAASAMTNGVNRLMLSNDCKDTELSFENTQDTNYANNARADGGCKLFSSTGAGVSYLPPNTNWFDPALASVVPSIYGKWFFINGTCVDGVGTGYGSSCYQNGVTTDTDLVVMLPYLKKSVCNAINDSLGFPRLANDAIQREGHNGYNFAVNGQRFVGTYNQRDVIYGSTDNGGSNKAFVGKLEGCFWSGNAHPVFYQVLLAR